MRILLFGATGSAGGSVLRVCLESSAVTTVRAIVRRPLTGSHAKLSVVVHEEFADYTGVESMFEGVDACFYCLGKSAQQVKDEAAYRHLTRDFALAAAAVLRAHSPAAVFHFLSGHGASLSSSLMWARVKAETERDLAPFNAVCWRPGLIAGLPSASEPPLYKVMRPFARLFLSGLRNWYVTGEDIGRAMLVATADGARNRTFDNAEIRDLARRG